MPGAPAHRGPLPPGGLLPVAPPAAAAPLAQRPASSRRAPLLGVLALGCGAGLASIAAAALLLGEAAPVPAAPGWAVAAGLPGTVGLASLHRGFAVGWMAPVAPVPAVLLAALAAAPGAIALIGG